MEPETVASPVQQFPRRTPDRTSPKVKGIDWVPRQTDDELARMAEILRAGQPVEPLYDLLDQVLGADARPGDVEIEELTERFRGVLMQLVAVVVDRIRYRPGSKTETLVERARELRAEDAPANVTPIAHLRRLALVTEDVLDLLLDGSPQAGAA
ncbi:DUF6415 family natural product biosynthesis protein (plasmid) [Streptomyces sp. NBC_00536]|uniref:DUF6415 family natural product biosynthesis protein n=1 Tax=Streptomyces sp. NBC_00536 TaxID=2975769 RepID=UPI002E81E8C1|nr:DUF6415 family natural product biosynthesis protein [Streptomyces sp. NBC_00536]WUC84323.1 DUF6415 family natural product biosynthesis protein [Streptomyces sp. NBC_00536]